MKPRIKHRDADHIWWSDGWVTHLVSFRRFDFTMALLLDNHGRLKRFKPFYGHDNGLWAARVWLEGVG